MSQIAGGTREQSSTRRGYRFDTPVGGGDWGKGLEEVRGKSQCLEVVFQHLRGTSGIFERLVRLVNSLAAVR